jgi:hypothetical protein
MFTFNNIVPIGAQSRSARIISRAEIEACRRSPVLAALLTDDLATGRAVLPRRLTDAQALRLTAADPRDLYSVRALKPAQRAEIEKNGAGFQSVTEWRYHRKKLHQAARRAAERSRWVEFVRETNRKAAERQAEAALEAV